MRLRVGTRGSDLALIQTRSVCDHLRSQRSGLDIEEVVIATHGDRHPDHSVIADDWPMGGFTSAIERALLDGRIDFAVHSLKDLPVEETPGTRLAAIPLREGAHDVLVTAAPITLDSFPPNLRIGTSSPRRVAQIRRIAAIETVPIRGNVPTRISRVGKDLDGVIVAAAGLSRLGIKPRYLIELPLARFVPAPGQGALAAQIRDGDDETSSVIARIDDPATRAAVTAERMLLAQLGGGCAAPVGAHAKIEPNGTIVLRGQVFSADGRHEENDVKTGRDPIEVARELARRLSHGLAESIR